MFKKCEHRTDILRSHQTTHVQLCIVNMVSPDVEQRLRSGRRGEPFSHEPAESVRSLRLTGLTSLQMDSLVLGDTRVLFCLRFHGLLDNNEKSAPVDSRARGCQPWGRWPPCPCSLPRSLPTPLTWCQPFHSCTWPHLVTHPRPENISSLPAPPPSSTSSLPFFIRSSLHFENLLPQTMSQASCLSGCFPWDHHLVVLTVLADPGSIHSVFDSDFPDLDLNLTTTVGCLSGFGTAHQFMLPLLTSAPLLICLLGVFVADSINHCRF